jgi:hypothetical protein
MRQRLQTALIAGAVAGAVAVGGAYADRPAAQQSAGAKLKVLRSIDKRLKTLNRGTEAQLKRLNGEVAAMHASMGRDADAGMRRQIRDLATALATLDRIERGIAQVANNTNFEEAP